MRARFASVAVSVIAHAGAFAWFAGHVSADLALARTAPTSAVPRSALGVTKPEPAPMVVELLDLAAMPPLPELPPAPPTTAGGSAAPARVSRIATPGARAGDEHTTEKPASGEASTPATGGASAPTAGPRSPLAMRSPRIAATLSERFLERFLEHAPPLPPAPPQINAAAHANDKKIADLDSLLAAPMYDEIATDDEIAKTEADLRSLQRERENLTMTPSGGGRYHNDQYTFGIDIAPDGTVAIHDKPPIKPEGLGFRYDLEGMLMRRHGDDPYARSKLHFLDATRDERAELGRRYETQRLSRSVELMRNNIDWLWSRTRDPAKRREVLFDLWDECAETGDPELVAGGAAARLLLIGEIRARLHGADAYTPDELARLNAHRHSTERFAPYVDPVDHGRE